MGTAEGERGRGIRRRATASSPAETGLPVEASDQEVLRGVLEVQLATYLNRRNEILEDHNPRQERERRFLQKTFSGIIEERNQRAFDLLSDEGKRANEIAVRLMPLPTYFDDCIDSRVMRTIKYGIPLGTGGAMRRPAGDMAEFVPAQGGGLVLLEGSYFAQALNDAFQRDDINVQALDSHIGCAAREKDERDKGLNPTDNGLLADVIRKKAMASAMKEYVTNKHPDKRVVPIQTSFDPHNGFMYMGLEKSEILAQARHAGGFTPELLEQLKVKREIIHTEAFLEDDTIADLFGRHKIVSFDWESNYRSTILSFWTNLESMTNEGLLDHIAQKVKRIYPDCEGDELKQRSMMLAMNSYNAYHLNMMEGGYPNAKHKESCVVVSEGEHGPYGEYPSFSVFSKATADYDSNIGLAAGIIRDNRENERIIDKTNEYTNQGHEDVHNFVAAPVPVLHKVIIRSNGVNWNEVRNLIWSDGFIPENWHAMTTEDFKQHVEKISPNVPLNVLSAVETLRQEMAAMTNPQKLTGQRIFGGQLEVVPALVDSSRTIHTLVPFIHSGYSSPTRSVDIFSRP